MQPLTPLDRRTLMKFVASHPFAAAARKLMEIANAIEPVQDGRPRAGGWTTIA